MVDRRSGVTTAASSFARRGGRAAPSASVYSLVVSAVFLIATVSGCTAAEPDPVQPQDLEVNAVVEAVPPSSLRETMREFGYDVEHDGQETEATVVKLHWRTANAGTVPGDLHFFVQWPEHEWQYISWRTGAPISLSLGTDQTTRQLADEYGFLSAFRTVRDEAGGQTSAGPPVFTFFSEEGPLPGEASVNLLFQANTPAKPSGRFSVDVAVGYTRGHTLHWAKEIAPRESDR